MAKRKRKRTHRRLASAALLSAPRRRKRSRSSLSTAPRKRKRSRGMSEGVIQMKGEAGKYLNPMGDGAVGGAVSHGAVKLIPETIFTSNPSLQKNEKWIKRGVKFGLGLLAVKLKMPLVAAGIAGALTEELMTTEGILNEGMNGHSLRATKYANPTLLRDGRLLADSRLLAEDNNFYPQYLYRGTGLNESPDEEINY